MRVRMRFRHILSKDLWRRRLLQNTGIKSVQLLKYPLKQFLKEHKVTIGRFIRSKMEELNGIKVKLCLTVLLQHDETGVYVDKPRHSGAYYYPFQTSEDIFENLGYMLKILAETHARGLQEEEGSGWRFVGIIGMDIHVDRYEAFKGGSFIPTPKALQNSKYQVLNIETRKTNDCLKYVCEASMLGEKMGKNNMKRPVSYNMDECKLDWSGVNFPSSKKDIKRLEKNNPNMSVNVYTYGDKTCLITPLYCSRKDKAHVTDLLLLKKLDKKGCDIFHYCLLKSLSALMPRSITGKEKGKKTKRYICRRCLNIYWTQASLDEHKEFCMTNNPTKVEMPVKGENDICKFENVERMEEVPITFYFDYETIPEKVHYEKRFGKYTKVVTRHRISSFGLKVCNKIDKAYNKTHVYRGKDAKDKITTIFEEEVKRAYEWIKERKNRFKSIKNMIISPEQEMRYRKAVECTYCQVKFDEGTKKKVRHHSHLTGQFIEAACIGCNLRLQVPGHIPAIGHHMSGYDGHHVVRARARNNDFNMARQCPDNFIIYLNFVWTS